MPSRLNERDSGLYAALGEWKATVSPPGLPRTRGRVGEGYFSTWIDGQALPMSWLISASASNQSCIA